MQEPERRSGCGCGSPLRAFSIIDCQKTCSPKACHQGIQLSYHIFRARRVRDRSCRCHSSCQACWTSCSRWACRPCWACRAGCSSRSCRAYRSGCSCRTRRSHRTLRSCRSSRTRRTCCSGCSCCSHRALRSCLSSWACCSGCPCRSRRTYCSGRGDVKRKVAITLKNQGEIKNKRLSHYAESRPGKTGRLFCVVGLERRKIFLVEN